MMLVGLARRISKRKRQIRSFERWSEILELSAWEVIGRFWPKSNILDWYLTKGKLQVALNTITTFAFYERQDSGDSPLVTSKAQFIDDSSFALQMLRLVQRLGSLH